MALLFLDSFDHYATADLAEKWTTIGTGTVSPSIAAAGRTSNSLRWTTAIAGATMQSLTLTRSNGPGDATVIVGFAYKNNAVATSFVWNNQSRFLSIWDGGTFKFAMIMNDDGTWSCGPDVYGETYTSSGARNIKRRSGVSDSVIDNNLLRLSQTYEKWSCMSRTPMITLDSDITGGEFGWRPFLPQTEGGLITLPATSTSLQSEMMVRVNDYGWKCA